MQIVAWAKSSTLPEDWSSATPVAWCWIAFVLAANSKIDMTPVTVDLKRGSRRTPAAAFDPMWSTNSIRKGGAHVSLKFTSGLREEPFEQSELFVGQ
jgi:hypothetical protein